MVDVTRWEAAAAAVHMAGAGLLPSEGRQVMWEGLVDGMYLVASWFHIACFAVAALMGWVGQVPLRVGSVASLQCSRVGGVPSQFSPIACMYSNQDRSESRNVSRTAWVL